MRFAHYCSKIEIKIHTNKNMRILVYYMYDKIIININSTLKSKIYLQLILAIHHIKKRLLVYFR